MYKLYANSGDTICGVFGCNRVVNQFWLDSVTGFSSTTNFIGLGFSIFFVIILLVGIFRIIRSVYLIIIGAEKSDVLQSQRKNIQNIFVSIGMMFIGLIGLVIIFAIFNFQVPGVNL